MFMNGLASASAAIEPMSKEDDLSIAVPLTLANFGHESSGPLDEVEVELHEPRSLREWPIRSDGFGGRYRHEGLLIEA